VLLPRLHRRWIWMIAGRLGNESGRGKRMLTVFSSHLNASDPVRLRRLGINTAQALVFTSLAQRSLPRALGLGCPACRAGAIGSFSLRTLAPVFCNLLDLWRCGISRTYQTEAGTVSTFSGPLITLDLDSMSDQQHGIEILAVSPYGHDKCDSL
jgi:hypothetical protein